MDLYHAKIFPWHNWFPYSSVVMYDCLVIYDVIVTTLIRVVL